jgi:hypothetical protein
MIKIKNKTYEYPVDFFIPARTADINTASIAM